MYGIIHWTKPYIRGQFLEESHALNPDEFGWVDIEDLRQRLLISTSGLQAWGRHEGSSEYDSPDIENEDSYGDIVDDLINEKKRTEIDNTLDSLITGRN
ncbi:MAG: hypothetical protein OXI60_07735 [Acidiferrobacterales bacterium]|nr:hypothetical protein [Acidiferrobacterales bacterium]